MRLTISITAPGAVPEQAPVSLELPETMTVADLKALIESETTFPNNSQFLYHNGQLLADQSMALDRLGIADGEMLYMHVRDTVPSSVGRSITTGGRRPPAPSAGGGGAAAPDGAGGMAGPARPGRDGGPDPEMVRLQILGDPQARAQVQGQNPDLAAALEQPERFRQLFQNMRQQEVEADRQRQRQIAMLNDDPFNPESQAQIEELIRQEAVRENLQNALEHHPEAFGKVHMLYIDVEVNGHQVKAFVDSGAQATIMSPSCAEACGIMRLVDKRFAGIARGVGTAQIIGRVHSAQIKIGRSFLACSFTVMEGKDVDLLLGLDMLKRHLACIDLRRGMLVIQDDEVAFLGEADIPKEQRDHRDDEPTVEGPGGTKLGGRSGAVLQTTDPTPASFGGPSPAVVSGGGGPLQVSSSSSTSERSSNVVHHAGGPTGPAGSTSIPSSSTAATAATSLATSPHQDDPHSPQAIEQLQQLGFSRDEAIAALTATGGNVDYAAGLLFQER